MRYIYLLVLPIIFIATNATAQSIQNKHTNKLDSVRNASDIKAILINIDSGYSSITINDNYGSEQCQKFADSLQVQTWVRTDFDQNGYTDILVLTERGQCTPLCIMDSGENHFRVVPVYLHWDEQCKLPVFKMIDHRPSIIYYSAYESMIRNPTPHYVLNFKVDTLVYEYGDFIELNRQPSHHQIDKIEFSTDYCFGTCPVFELKINKDLSAEYNPIAYNKTEGKFKGIIDQSEYSELTSLLNYINFEKLDTSYSILVTDQPSCTLNITYDNGKTKKIYDYAEQGTFGLSTLYNILFKMRNTHWERIYEKDFIQNDNIQRTIEH
jgi:hypothetical protein